MLAQLASVRQLLRLFARDLDTLDAAASRRIARALEQAGVRTPSCGQRIADYELEQLLGEGDNWQDFSARHATIGVKRQIRMS
jgi:hypothetical protein